MASGKDKWKKVKTKEEIEDGARRILDRFRRACETYDSGVIDEADHIAACIYMIVSDGSGQRCVTTQLGIKQKLRFRAEPEREPGVVTYNPPLVGLFMPESGKAYWTPITGECPTEIMTDKFSKWWTGKVYRNKAGLDLSRQNIVSAMRNHDAGGHSGDEWKDEAYYRFLTYGDHFNTNDAGTLSISVADQEGMDNKNLHYMTMRTIAWELDCALKLVGI